MTALCVLPVLMHVEIGGNEQNDHCRAIKVFQCFCAAPESSCSVWDLRDISKTGLKCLLDFSYSCMVYAADIILFSDRKSGEATSIASISLQCVLLESDYICDISEKCMLLCKTTDSYSFKKCVTIQNYYYLCFILHSTSLGSKHENGKVKSIGYMVL